MSADEQRRADGIAVGFRAAGGGTGAPRPDSRSRRSPCCSHCLPPRC